MFDTIFLRLTKYAIVLCILPLLLNQLVFAQNNMPGINDNNPLTQGNSPTAHKLEKFSINSFNQFMLEKHVKLPKMISNDKRKLRNISFAFKKKEYSQVEEGWKKLIISMGNTNNINDQDIMATLFHVFKESIESINEDMKYFNKKLEDMNKIKDALNDYVDELNDMMIEYENSSEEEEILIKIITCIPTRFSNNIKLKIAYQKLSKYKFNQYKTSLDDYIRNITKEQKSAKIDFQNAKERQLQTTQIINRMSQKMKTDAMSIVSSIRQ